MTKTNTPFAAFDMSKFMTDFDPGKITAEFAKMAGAMDFKTVDVDAIMKAQQKNLDALNAASAAVVEGVKAVASYQSEVFKTTLADTQTAISKMNDIKTPQDAVARQTELMVGTIETSLTTIRQLAGMVTKSQTASTQKINTRIDESLDELKAQTVKPKK